MNFQFDKSLFFFVSVSRYAHEELNKFDRGAITDAKQALYNTFKTLYQLDKDTEKERKIFHFISDPIDRDSLLNSLESAMQDNEGNIKHDLDFIFFYFCGHGQIDTNNEFLILPMTNSKKGRELKSKELFDTLTKASKAKVFVILDCCYSGSAFLPIEHKHFCILASSERDQRSYKGKRYPVFSELLIEYLNKAILEMESLSIGDVVDYIDTGKGILYEDENARVQKATSISKGDVKSVNIFNGNQVRSPNYIQSLESSGNTTPSTPLSDILTEIRNKDTNYIFLFGELGAGKTAITSSLIHYLDTRAEEGTLFPADGTQYKRAEFHNHVRNQFKKGIFLSRSKIETLEVSLMHKDFKRETKMTFLEMSGENFNEIARGPSGEYSEGVEKYLRCNGINIVFFLVVNHKNAHKKDLFMTNFLEYLEDLPTKDRKQSVLLLVSQWDTYNGRYKEDVESFVRNNMPYTYAKLNVINATITSYSVGKIFQDQLIDIDKIHPAKVKKWLFNEIASSPTKGNLWKTIRDFFSKTFSRYN